MAESAAAAREAAQQAATEQAAVLARIRAEEQAAAHKALAERAEAEKAAAERAAAQQAAAASCDQAAAEKAADRASSFQSPVALPVANPPQQAPVLLASLPPLDVAPEGTSVEPAVFISPVQPVPPVPNAIAEPSQMTPSMLAEKRKAETAAVRAMIASRSSFIAEQRARIAAISPRQALLNGAS